MMVLMFGYLLFDDVEGWGWFNLFVVVDGYVNFVGDVSVMMDVLFGGFNVVDIWCNDIGGDGKLMFVGMGVLMFVGVNIYCGGMEVWGGMFVVGLLQVFGVGDVYVGGGMVVIKVVVCVNINGCYMQLKGGMLEFDCGVGDVG